MNKHRKHWLPLLLAFLLALPLPALAQQVYAWQGDVAVFRENEHFGLIGPGGIVCPAEYDWLEAFTHGGLARVEKVGLSGAIDRSGQLVIPLEPLPLKSNRDTLDPRRDPDLWYRQSMDSYAVYRPDGSLIGDRVWLEGLGFENGAGLVRSQEGWTLLHRDGRLLVDGWWQEAENRFGNFLLYRENEGLLVDATGQVLAQLVPDREYGWRTVAWYDRENQQMRQSPWDDVELLYSDRIGYRVGDDQWGLADMAGDPLSESIIDGFWSHDLDKPAPETLIVCTEQGFGLMSRDGQLLTDGWGILHALGDRLFFADFSEIDGTLYPSGEMISVLPDGHHMAQWQPGMPYQVFPITDRVDVQSAVAFCPETGRTFHVFDETSWMPFGETYGSGLLPVQNPEGVVGLMNGPGGEVITDPLWQYTSFFPRDYCVFGGEGVTSYVHLDTLQATNIYGDYIPMSPVELDGTVYFPAALVMDGEYFTCWFNSDGQLVSGL